jgi:hypothetical protein
MMFASSQRGGRFIRRIRRGRMNQLIELINSRVGLIAFIQRANDANPTRRVACVACVGSTSFSRRIKFSHPTRISFNGINLVRALRRMRRINPPI